MTERDIDGRLFPAEEIGDWLLSAQADVGYQCSPVAFLPRLEDYDDVEVKIDGPHGLPVDPTTLGLPEGIADKFTPLSEGAPSLGCHVTLAELDVIRRALLFAGMNPNAGVPRGRFGWPGRTVWHGAAAEDAEAIAETGIDMGASGGGYFGHAFYVADEPGLAWSNYADFSGDEEGGAVVSFDIEEGARILDLRNPVDSEEWMQSGLTAKLGNPNIAAHAVRAGIDGVYDRSVGGLAIYNRNVLRLVGLERKDDRGAAPRGP
jgi:hypothetical protein